MSKFRIKISPWYASDDFFTVKYSTNGIFWKTLKQYKYDVLDEWCYMVSAIFNYTDAEYIMSKFKNMEDIIKYEETERKRVIDHNKEIKDKRKRVKETKKLIYKKI